MPAMTRVHAALCRSAPWRGITRRVVLPWALQGYTPTGHVLEIGAGSGAMAEQLLRSYPALVMTATDFDHEMVDVIATRLETFGDRVAVQPADATELPFADDSFDAALSWVMLHHTVEWEKALAEAVRVVRPGGHVVAYDLLSTPLLRALHRNDEDHLRLIGLRELRERVQALPVDDIAVTPSLGGFVARFALRVR
jgi:ubiquinone/menaquinone biosynthesis C-methylase UbiE